MKRRLIPAALLLLALSSFSAEGAARKASNPALQPNPRKLNPPPGIPVPPEVKAELEAGASALGQEIDSLRAALEGKSALLELLPDVQIFQNAVRYAVEDDIFYSTNQFKSARALLKEGMERARQLRQGQAPWNTATGSVVRGYLSRLDGSVQPYGLVVPPTYQAGGKPMRLDFWLHGRGDNLSEISFIEGRQKGGGEFTPANTFVLHPYGRFMNAFKFAGEVDVFEALEHARKHYPIDDHRIAMRGFSMGGAGSWHLGAHHAETWAAVNPGAGFVDVKNYQNLGGKLSGIPWYEQKLWSLYDPLACPINFVNTTLVAYSGEIDEQKKAADLMEAALASEGVKMTHIIGPQTGHKYEPEAKKTVAKLVDAAMAKGRDPVPSKVHLVTYSLKWNSMHWVRVEALEKQWEKAEVVAEIITEKDAIRIQVTTTNVAAISFNIASASTLGKRARLIIDGQDLGVRNTVLFLSSETWWAAFARKSKPAGQESRGAWMLESAPAEGKSLSKRHDLQGPIDDAFMNSFIFVRPTGQALNDAAGQWVRAEMREAAFQWRRQLRGEVRMKDDSAINDADIAAHNLILWGDPSSNRLLARMAGKLPISWTAEGIKIGAKTYDAARHIPALIYPNPLNPARYVVLNSGFTFAQFAAGSNAQQTPKLPDWALLDLGVPFSERVGGKGVVDADFFGESWELREARK